MRAKLRNFRKVLKEFLSFFCVLGATSFYVPTITILRCTITHTLIRSYTYTQFTRRKQCSKRRYIKVISTFSDRAQLSSFFFFCLTCLIISARKTVKFCRNSLWQISDVDHHHTDTRKSKKGQVG